MRLWPGSLGGRLVVMLVTALAIVQGILFVVLHDEQRAVVETMAHGRALEQTVTLARLIAANPPAEADRVLAAFGSRTSCAVLVASNVMPAAEAQSRAERHLTRMLERMLHGGYAGSPRVTIEAADSGGNPCGSGPSPYPHGKPDDEDRKEPKGDYSADLFVPLTDGRILLYRTVVEAGPMLSGVAALSFVLAAIVVAAVVVVAVGQQTRPLRDLAQAAERFGRGETVAPVAVRGPTEIATLIATFDTMKERLSRFVEERLRLLAAVSHDLRTPLTTLRLKAEFIDDEATRDDLVATIDELTAITEATLAFTRAEVAREETRTIDLVDLVGEVVADFDLAGHDVGLAGSGPVSCHCRPVALKRAIRNLLENAARYGGGARVSVAATEAGPTIVVEDDGPGLPEDRVEDAFTPFVRLEPSRNAETGGLGLGLAIARGIVQSHGGTITLANRPEGGLRAEIRLPRRG